MNPQSADLGPDEMAGALKREKKVLLTVHINPDGDALGSLIATHRALTQLGIDSAMYLAGDEPTAPEYKFLSGLDEIHKGQPPADAGQRTLISLDCGNAERIGNEELVENAPRRINIDHHGDNSRFGDLNLVDSAASSTAEIVYRLLVLMEAEITPEIATALYTGILVDSGRFQYAGATAATFRAAADLIDRGVDHTAVFRYVYENMPLSKAKLLCGMLTTMVIRCDGRLAVGILDEKAFEEAGAGNGLTEGLVDNLRAIEGVQVAALIYRRPRQPEIDGKPEYRVSLRSSSYELNVQRIASKKDGGGHKQASGFSAAETPEALIDFLEAEVCGASRSQEKQSS